MIKSIKICQNLSKSVKLYPLPPLGSDVSDLSVEMFEELYAYSHRPLVVRNASIFWDALQVRLIKQNYLSIVR